MWRPERRPGANQPERKSSSGALRRCVPAPLAGAPLSRTLRAGRRPILRPQPLPCPSGPQLRPGPSRGNPTRAPKSTPHHRRPPRQGRCGARGARRGGAANPGAQCQNGCRTGCPSVRNMPLWILAAVCAGVPVGFQAQGVRLWPKHNNNIAAQNMPPGGYRIRKRSSQEYAAGRPPGGASRRTASCGRRQNPSSRKASLE